MFNIGPAELAVILIAALIILGPKRLPELARTIGKFMREFRRQTDDVRNLVEREFYKMDEEMDLNRPAQRPPPVLPAPGAVAVNSPPDPGHDAQGRLIAPPASASLDSARDERAEPKPAPSAADPKAGEP